MKKITWFIKIAMCVLMPVLLVSGDIYFLEGYGKSSVADIMRNQDEWGVVASLYWDWSPKKLAIMFSDEMAAINVAIASENVIHALRRDMVMFKSESTEEEQSLASKAMTTIRNAFNNDTDSSLYKNYTDGFQEYSHSKIQEAVNAKKHVLVDGSWYLDMNTLAPGATKYSALLYCSFAKMIARNKEQNKRCLEQEHLLKHRFLGAALWTFLNLYTLSSEKTENTIDTLDKASVKRTLKSVRACLRPAASSDKENYIVQEYTQEQFDEYASNLLAKFGNNEQLYVVPNKQYDLILNTNKLNPEQCAQEILNFANSKHE